jgi:hypothetical protein
MKWNGLFLMKGNIHLGYSMLGHNNCSSCFTATEILK